MSKPTNPNSPAALITWGKPKSVKIEQVHLGRSGYTSSGHSAVALFDVLKAELNGTEGGLHAVSVTAFQLPVQADLKNGFVGFLIHIRGAASVSAGGRVSLMVSVNGRAEVWPATIRTFISGV